MSLTTQALSKQKLLRIPDRGRARALGVLWQPTACSANREVLLQAFLVRAIWGPNSSLLALAQPNLPGPGTH